MPRQRARHKRVTCLSFRKKRNAFEYVDDPSQSPRTNRSESVRDSTAKASLRKENDAESDTTDDPECFTPEDGNFEHYDPYVTSFNPAKEKNLRKRPKSKQKSNRSQSTEPGNLSRQSTVHETPESKYLDYGPVELQNDFQRLKTADAYEAKLPPNYHSFDRESLLGEPAKEGSKLLIGGRMSDGKANIERRIWDMLERRGWGMVGDGWNVMDPRVFDKIVGFLSGMEISLCRQVSKGWCKSVTEAMAMRSEVIVAAFKRVYGDALEYDRSYILFQPVLTATRSLRIDLIIRARVCSFCTSHKNSFGYTYSYRNPFDSCPSGYSASGLNGNGRNKFGLFNRRPSRGANSECPGSDKKSVFICKFMFEVLNKNTSRRITFTRDLSNLNSDFLNLATSASVSQVCEGDFIEIPVTLINAIGTTDVDSINFLPLVRDVITNSPSQLDLLHREWYTVEPNSKYLEQLFPQNIHSYSIIHPHKLLPQLVHQVTQVAGIDVITSKSSYIASHLALNTTLALSISQEGLARANLHTQYLARTIMRDMFEDTQNYFISFNDYIKKIEREKFIVRAEKFFKEHMVRYNKFVNAARELDREFKALKHMDYSEEQVEIFRKKLALVDKAFTRASTTYNKSFRGMSMCLTKLNEEKIMYTDAEVFKLYNKITVSTLNYLKSLEICIQILNQRSDECGTLASRDQFFTQAVDKMKRLFEQVEQISNEYPLSVLKEEEYDKMIQDYGDVKEKYESGMDALENFDLSLGEKYTAQGIQYNSDFKKTIQMIRMLPYRISGFSPSKLLSTFLLSLLVLSQI